MKMSRQRKNFDTFPLEDSDLASIDNTQDLYDLMDAYELGEFDRDDRWSSDEYEYYDEDNYGYGDKD